MDDSLAPVVQAYITRMAEGNAFRRYDHEGVPTHDDVVFLVREARQILFPGYFNKEHLPASQLHEYVGCRIERLYQRVAQLSAAALFKTGRLTEFPGLSADEAGRSVAQSFLEQLPSIKEMLDDDVRAAYDGDPAAKNHDEIIFSYPGLLALTIYRIAHELEVLRVPYIPRMMTEYAHSRTGIDIHPGARIGRSFFIDHGTGVVIGETSEIGHRVRLYQGVTLGALSLPAHAGNLYRNLKRHPTIEDDVIIYANSTILGGDTVIGARSVIGGNNWVTESVPADTRVIASRPDLTFTPRTSNTMA